MTAPALRLWFAYSVRVCMSSSLSNKKKKKKKKEKKKKKKKKKNNTEMGMLGAEGGGREEGGNTDWLTADTDSHRVLNVGLTVSLFRV